MFDRTVSKDAFDAVVDERDYLRKQVASLNAQLQQMRLSGASFTTPTGVTVVKPKPDPIAAAIASHPASRDPKVRAAMWAQADQDKADGASPDEIALRIRGRLTLAHSGGDSST